MGDHIHFPLLLCVILVFQLTFDSKNLGGFIMPHFGTDHLIYLRAKAEDISQLPVLLPSMSSCFKLLYTVLKVLYKVLKSITLLGSVLKAVGHTVSLVCSGSQWKQG